MQSFPDIEIRLLFESDIPAAMRLKEAAGWNQTENDWLRLLRLEPKGCFGAVKDGRLVGSTTTTTYDSDLAWIGMVLVEPESRRLGIATSLMKTAMQYLDGKVAVVKLDATPEGKPVYEKFGFKVESIFERWVRPGSSTSLQTQSYPLAVDIRRELLQLDRLSFHADRSKLVESLIDGAIVPTVLLRNPNGELSGYALARRGTKATYIGPVVATEPDQVESLLEQTLSQMNGARVYIDFNPECGAPTTVLSERGFVEERELIRMSVGSVAKKTSPFMVAIAGPEIG